MSRRAILMCFVVVPAALAAAAYWYVRGPFVAREVPILMYHHIEYPAADMWVVPPADFEAQMRQLKENGYETILPADLAAYAHRRGSLPRRSGYR